MKIKLSKYRFHLRKRPLFLIMRMFIFFFITTAFGFSTETSFAQEIITIENDQEVTIDQVFDLIQNQTDYHFLYPQDMFSQAPKVQLKKGVIKVEKLLDEALQRANVEFELLENNTIVIKQKSPPPPVVTVVKPQKITIKGVVKDSKGVPLYGANVIEKGTANGTTTDFDGKYSIEVNPNAILTYTFIGFIEQEISTVDKLEINVTLEEESTVLDDVVIVGYGVQRKSDLTGAIAQVKSDDMENRTTVSTQQALQGKAAGVQVIQTSGAPGSTGTVRIRGFSSNSGSDPLYVVDGLRTSDIGAIDPTNIESIEILKDAASAAIYGAQAGNGVVLITTKKGKMGKGKIEYSAQFTMNQLNNIPEVMNAEQYINYMTEGNIITESEIDNLWDGTTDTNWSDIAFENSFMQKHNLGFQAGNEKGSYYVGLSYLDQDGIVFGDSDTYERITGMINASFNVKPWLKVGTTNTLEKWQSQSVSESSEYGSLLAAVLTMDPLTPNIYHPGELPDFMQNLLDNGKVLLTDGNGDYYAISKIFESEQVHPGIMRDNTLNKNDGGNILGTIYTDIKPTKNLIFTSKLGYRASFSNTYSFAKIFYANAVLYRDNVNVSRTTSNSLYYQWENFVNYMFSVDKHNFTAMLGTSYQNSKTTYVSGSGDQITRDDPAFWDLDYLADAATRTVGGGYTLNRQLSYFGRISYNYEDKYLFQASMRRDASDTSILSEENRWGTFPSFSAGYVISKENFFPKVDAIDFFKIRGSWGQNGSTGPLGGYAYRAAISSDGSYPYSDDVVYQVASAPSTLSNPDLKWETSEQLDLGFDLRAFSNKFSLTVDYYHKKTKDLLVAITPPYETGVASTIVNAGNVSNKGLEIETAWNQQVNPDFSYGIRANLATLKNEVTYLDPSISRIAGASYHTNTGITAFEEGFPVWYFRGYQVEDIDDATGDPIFKDQLTVDTDGDGKADAADGVINDDDKTMIGSAIPDFTYGITLTAKYKAIDFTVFGTGSEGNDIFNALTRTDRPRGNKLTTFYNDRWTATNTDASRPRPNANGEDKYWISDDVIFDGSFFKIKQIQLGYTLPERFLKNTFISGCRIYGSLDDWFVFTKYPGMDPEASAGAVSALGVDKGAYPISRKAVLGVNLNF